MSNISIDIKDANSKMQEIMTLLENTNTVWRLFESNISNAFHDKNNVRTIKDKQYKSILKMIESCIYEEHKLITKN